MTATEETLPSDVLMAYADGTLDAEARARLEADAMNDPLLAGKLAALRKVSARRAADATPPARYRLGPLSLSTPQLIAVWLVGMALVLGLGFVTGKRFHALHAQPAGVAGAPR